ncbi:hypothetical protein [Thalassospira lucentensis]|uniref:hypothetical protein n=1 Tax=Thalassospira lucentensis TaxID=168935 RepID=UPI0020CA7D12|nr:hypothetical protein [Thalassospira lucentensis]
MTVSKLSHLFRTTFVVATLSFLAACSQKAETLKLTVTQFGTATEEAFDSYGAAYAAQFKPFEKSPADKRDTFVANMDAFTGTVSAANIDVLMAPDGAKIDPSVARKWQETLSRLRMQYQQFVAIFDNIEAGAVLGASAVKKSGPILEKLRAQLKAITSNFTQNPPEFLAKRSTLIAKLNAIRNDPDKDPELSTLRYETWWQDWESLVLAEQNMQGETLRNFVRANALGDHLQNLIDNYASLDMTSLLNAVEQGILQAHQINNMSPQELMSQSTALAETATK